MILTLLQDFSESNITVSRVERGPVPLMRFISTLDLSDGDELMVQAEQPGGGSSHFWSANDILDKDK